jgi:hypothetical protein
MESISKKIIAVFDNPNWRPEDYHCLVDGYVLIKDFDKEQKSAAQYLVAHAVHDHNTMVKLAGYLVDCLGPSERFAVDILTLLSAICVDNMMENNCLIRSIPKLGELFRNNNYRIDHAIYRFVESANKDGSFVTALMNNKFDRLDAKWNIMLVAVSGRMSDLKIVDIVRADFGENPLYTRSIGNKISKFLPKYDSDRMSQFVSTDGRFYFITN